MPARNDLRQKAAMRLALRAVKKAAEQEMTVHGDGPLAEEALKIKTHLAQQAQAILQPICQQSCHYLTFAITANQALDAAEHHLTIPRNIIQHQDENRPWWDREYSAWRDLTSPLANAQFEVEKRLAPDFRSDEILRSLPPSEGSVTRQMKLRRFWVACDQALQEERDWAARADHDQGKLTNYAAHNVETILDRYRSLKMRNTVALGYMLTFSLERTRRSFRENWNDEYSCGSSCYGKLINVAQTLMKQAET